jgi:hypothetical protein
VKLFISWSGPVSRDVAMALRNWLPSVLQAVDPYVSSEDIDPGVRWGGDLAQQLEGTNFGILCITRDNVESPWINFEAGALSKSVERSRVVPFLFDLSPTDIPQGPLTQFQAVQPTLEGVSRLIRGMNDLSAALPADRLQETVQVWWPRLERNLRDIREQAAHTSTSPELQRSPEDMLRELLDLTRGLQRQLSQSTESPERMIASAAREYHQAVLSALTELTALRGLHLINAPEGQYAPFDWTVKNEGHMLHIRVLHGLLGSVRKQIINISRDMELLGVAADPLLIVTNRRFSSSTMDSLPNEMYVVEWDSDKDNGALLGAIDSFT